MVNKYGIGPFVKGHPYFGGGWTKGKKRKSIPHPWNLSKRGTFVKRHIQPESVKKKISNTIMTKYTFEERSKKAKLAVSKQIVKNKFTKIELAFQEALSLINIGFVSQFKINEFTFDLYIPDCNCFIECDGDYWHSLPTNIKADKNKEEFCKNNNLKLIRFKEKDIKNNLLECINKLPGINYGK